MSEIIDKNHIQPKHSSKTKKILVGGLLATALLSSCSDKTSPVSTETKNWETIEQYSDFYVITSDKIHEVHVKNDAHIFVYAPAQIASKWTFWEVCITTKEHPEEIFSEESSFWDSDKYEIIYDKE